MFEMTVLLEGLSRRLSIWVLSCLSTSSLLLLLLLRTNCESFCTVSIRMKRLEIVCVIPKALDPVLMSNAKFLSNPLLLVMFRLQLLGSILHSNSDLWMAFLQKGLLPPRVLGHPQPHPLSPPIKKVSNFCSIWLLFLRLFTPSPPSLFAESSLEFHLNSFFFFLFSWVWSWKKNKKLDQHFFIIPRPLLLPHFPLVLWFWEQSALWDISRIHSLVTHFLSRNLPTNQRDAPEIGWGRKREEARLVLIKPPDMYSFFSHKRIRFDLFFWNWVDQI